MASLYGQEPITQANRLLRMLQGKVQESTQPPREWNGCTVVDLQSDIYVEQKTHWIRDQQAQQKAYYGRLSDEQFNTLTNILAADVWKSAAPREPRQMPFDVSDYSWVTAEIRHGTTLQNVGYFDWKLRASEYNGASQPYIARQKWNLKVIAPLLNWARSIGTTELTEIDPVAGMCN